MNLTNFLKNNQEKLFLALGFILVLCAGFFSGYFYSQDKIENWKVVVEKPDENCKRLFNADFVSDSSSIKNEPSTAQNSANSSGAKETEDSSSKETNLQNKTGMFVASKNSTIYHKPDCKYAKQIKEENKVWFKSAEEAEKAGYKPDKNCFK